MRIPIGDLTFDADEYGDAANPTSVLLHGFPESSASWTEVARPLAAARRHVVVPNQRGYSPDARPIGVEEYTIEKLTGDVVGMIDALGRDSVDLIGHDWGAIVAWHVAVLHPDRVRSLTAVSLPHPGAFGWALRNDEDQKQRSTYMTLFRQPGKAEDLLLENDAERLIAMFSGATDPTVARRHLPVVGHRDALTGGLNWYRAMTREFGDLGPCTVPTTYVWSTGDTAVGRVAAERTERHVDAPYRFVELGGSHWIPEDQPQRLVDEILAR